MLHRRDGIGCDNVNGRSAKPLGKMRCTTVPTGVPQTGIEDDLVSAGSGGIGGERNRMQETVASEVHEVDGFICKLV